MAYDKSLVQKASAETGVPATLLERVIAAESSGDPKAVSYRGEQYGEGLMQLSEGTAKELGVTDRTDPEQNVMGGARYLKTLLDRYGGDVDRALTTYVGASSPAKAADYVKKVTGHMPNASTTPAASPASAGYQPAIDDALKREKGDEAAFEAASKEASVHDKEFASRLESLGGKIEGIDAYLDKLSAATPKAPEEAKLPGYQPPQQKNPLQALAASMPLLLLAGSKMGRNKGLALMKTMSGVLNGVSAGNDETRKQYQEDFKAKTEQMVEQAKLDHEHYMDILESLREVKGDALAKIQVFGALSQNDALINAAKNGDFKRVADLAAIHDHFLTGLLQAQRAALESEQNAVKNKLDAMKINPTTQAYDEAYGEAIGQGKKPEEARQYAAEQAGSVARATQKGMAQAEWKEEDAMSKALTAKGTPGEAYRTLKSNLAKVDEAIHDPKQYLNVAGPAVIADTFTRVFNGGNAIRGFQMKMLTQNRSVKNTLEGALQKAATGGEFTPEEIKQMALAVKRVEPELRDAWREAAEEQIATAEGRRLDARNVIPPDLRDSVADLLKDAGNAPQAGGALPGLPDDLPPPSGLKDGTMAKDENGDVVAVVRNGQWTSPKAPA